ncbi:MAG: ABC transporter permease [Oscillospiraceae bacterium]
MIKKTKQSRFAFLGEINETTKKLLAINVVIFLLFTLLKPEKFPTLFNLKSMCFQFPEVGLFTIGIGMTMLTAGADLSIVAVANLVATVDGIILLGIMPPGSGTSTVIMYLVICIIVDILIGFLCGCLNGLLVAKLGIFPILATLGTQNLFTGISTILTKGQGVFGTFPEQLIFVGSGNLFGFLPMPLVVFAITLLATYIIIHHTPHGLKTQWFGSNSKASFFSGIDNVKTVFRTYMMSSFIGAITGILILARTNSAKYDYGTSYVLQAMLASVFAGISPLGGKGNMLNIFLSVFAIQMLDSGFNFLRISSFVRSSTYGLLLIVGILIDYIMDKRKERRQILEAAGTSSAN